MSEISKQQEDAATEVDAKTTTTAAAKKNPLVLMLTEFFELANEQMGTRCEKRLYALAEGLNNNKR